MEAVASFILIFLVYFLGTLAIVQEVIRPRRQLITLNGGKIKQWATNYSKIILLSLLLSFLTTSLAYWLFI
ncbi:hypothetical protein SAMN04488104_101828 [Algoriphagus faecimaris]|uniref:Uncharacterized protein n=1 Tax=Algoriphagus faecimaris TaxID=686796 RepID=A0A1G6SQ21_9BACT|nr:hypothetical protein [Algoriphagus faecimaris]SDD18970.1 hypothetical protein SAMN04488104_101828 [Algoriphagus faecimaris]